MNILTKRAQRGVAAFAVVLASAAALTACSFKAGEDNQGYEYAPDMYYPINDPYHQYGPNKYNPGGTNMRKPAEHTVPRNSVMQKQEPVELWSNYPYSLDSLDYAARTLRNPLPYNAENLGKGKYLYTAYCQSCHGDKGDGKGLVGEVYKGVANYNGTAYKGMTDGHIYHVITMGKGRMWPHGSQVLPRDRWLIVQYVNKLRGLTGPKNSGNSNTPEATSLGAAAAEASATSQGLGTNSNTNETTTP